MQNEQVPKIFLGAPFFYKVLSFTKCLVWPPGPFKTKPLSPEFPAVGLIIQFCPELPLFQIAPPTAHMQFLATVID